MLRHCVVPYPSGRARLKGLAAPGVYLFFAERVSVLAARLQAEGGTPALVAAFFDGRLPEPLYVGKAKTLSTRLASYFSGSRDEGGKARRLRQVARSVLAVECDSHFLACFLEIALIRRLAPALNVTSLAPSRAIFFERAAAGGRVALRGGLPPLSSTLGFSSSKIQVQDVLANLAAVSRSLEADVPFSLFHGRFHRERDAFSPREFFADATRTRALEDLLAGRPRALLSLVAARMRERAAAEDFAQAAHWRDALFTLRRFALQLRRSRRVLRAHRHEAVFECGEARVVVRRFEVLSLSWRGCEVVARPCGPRDDADDDFGDADGEGDDTGRAGEECLRRRGRNLTHGLRIHYELLRLIDAWIVKGDENCRFSRRTHPSRPWTVPRAPARRKPRSSSNDTDYP